MRFFLFRLMTCGWYCFCIAVSTVYCIFASKCFQTIYYTCSFFSNFCKNVITCFYPNTIAIRICATSVICDYICVICIFQFSWGNRNFNILSWFLKQLISYSLSPRINLSNSCTITGNICTPSGGIYVTLWCINRTLYNNRSIY